jgi:hypothetical protein
VNPFVYYKMFEIIIEQFLFNLHSNFGLSETLFSKN